MTSHVTSARRQKVRTLGAAFAVAMLLGGTAACSSDSKSADKSSSETDSKADSSATETESGSNGSLPDAFPADIPMPDFEKANVLKAATDDMPGNWNLILVIDPSMEESQESLVAAYSSQLEAAGYELSDSGAGGSMAENDKWTIIFHSSASGTLTIGTIPK